MSQVTLDTAHKAPRGELVISVSCLGLGLLWPYVQCTNKQGNCTLILRVSVSKKEQLYISQSKNLEIQIILKSKRGAVRSLPWPLWAVSMCWVTGYLGKNRHTHYIVIT